MKCHDMATKTVVGVFMDLNGYLSRHQISNFLVIEVIHSSKIRKEDGMFSSLIQRKATVSVNGTLFKKFC